MARRDSHFGNFGSVSLRERRSADQFFADLVGRRGSMPYETAEDDAPTIRLSSAEVLVCVGGVNNATVTATTTGGGTIAWRIADPSRASITGAGNSATIRGRHPGVTRVEATLTSGGTTVTASARLLVIFIELELSNRSTIEPSPENEDEATETATAGGTNALGALPMGTGRWEFPGLAYTSASLFVGRVFPHEAATRFTFKWQRLLTRRSWYLLRNAAGTRWNVTFRSSRGPLADDTGSSDFFDSTPSPGDKIYSYDNSALLLGPETTPVGGFVHEKKDFIYRVWVRLNGVWTLCSAVHMGQVITARRTATGGTVAADWAGVENSEAIRRIDTRISQAQARAIVGGTDPIDIAAAANA
jgi:hypothetical protein